MQSCCLEACRSSRAVAVFHRAFLHSSCGTSVPRVAPGRWKLGAILALRVRKDKTDVLAHGPPCASPSSVDDREKEGAAQQALLLVGARCCADLSLSTKAECSKPATATIARSQTVSGPGASCSPQVHGLHAKVGFEIQSTAPLQNRLTHGGIRHAARCLCDRLIAIVVFRRAPGPSPSDMRYSAVFLSATVIVAAH